MTGEERAMASFRGRPVVIEAMLYDGRNSAALFGWASGHDIGLHVLNDRIMVRDSDWVEPGDWVVKGIRGEVHSVNDAVFRSIFEAE
jgi:hypothetical protein